VRRFVVRGIRGRVVRCAADIAACFVLVAMSIQTAPPVLAAPTPAAQPAVQMPSAASLNHKQAPTEVPSLRDAYSNTYDNHDGTFTASVSAGPINYKPAGSSTYQPIDLAIAPIKGGNGRLRVSKTPVPIEIGAPDDPAGFVSVDTGEGVIRLRLATGYRPGLAGSNPAISNGQADVSGLLPGVDLQVIPAVDGDRLFLTLSSRPTSSFFVFALDSGGLTPALQADGSISFTDKAGTVVATMPAPYATDSTPDGRLGGGSYTNEVSYSLIGKGPNTLLTVGVDPTWLATATYPVFVDPSTTVSTTANVADTFIDAKYPTTNFHNYWGGTYYELLLGQDPSYPTQICYPLIRFNMPAAVMGSTINSAILEVDPWHQYYSPPTATTTWVDQITSSWSYSGVTWNTEPSHTGVIASQDLVQGQYSSFNVTSSVQGWANGQSDYGFLLHENGNGSTYWKRLIASTDSTKAIPLLAITYNLPIATPTSPISGNWTNSENLSWSYYDQSNISQTQSNVIVSTSPSLGSPIVSTGWVNNPAWNYTISANLTKGTTYYWEVQVAAGSDQSVQNSVASFRWDGTAPAAPTPLIPTSQADQTSLTAAFSWNAVNDPALVGYEVDPYWNTPSNGTCPSSGWNLISDGFQTATSFSITGSSGKCYLVAVRSKDQFYYSAWVNLPPILIDNTDPYHVFPPAVTNNCSTTSGCYSSGNTIYFQPAAANQITLTSTNPNPPPSGIAYSTFGSLSATGWAYIPGKAWGNGAHMSIGWPVGAGAASLSVSDTDGAGTFSASWTPINFVPDPGAMVQFGTPAPSGSPTIAVAPSQPFQVAWTETAGLSPITARILQRMTVASNADGTCPTSGWNPDGGPSSALTPVVIPAATLTAGQCYEWVETLTDSLGAHSFNSAAVYADTTAPAALISSPAAGQPLSGSATVTGTASDTYFSSCVLDYGPGATPSTWTSINTSCPHATNGTLGVWATGSLTGVYTLRLTVTDTVGNVSSTTNTVYLDNTDRDAASHNAAVPFDLDGGWNLSVNAATGEASLSRDLFSIPSYGPEQALSLTYNSADPSAGGMLGTGWSSNLTQYLSFESGFVVWHDADGVLVPFGKVGGSWTALAGHYETLSTNSAGAFVVTQKDQTALSFDPTSGRLTAITDRFGNSLALNWSANQPTATDASGRSTTITLSGSDITAVSDSAGRSWSFGYSSDGTELDTITDPAGNITTLGYTSGVLASVSRLRTPQGGTTAPVAWSLGYTGAQVTSVADPIGGAAYATTLAYTAGETKLTAERDPSGRSAPVNGTTTYDYESHGWVSQINDAAGFLTKFHYDDSGNLLTSSRQVDALAQTWATTSYTYYPSGNLWTQTDPTGILTTYTYNATNDVLTKIVSGTNPAPLSSTTQNLYDGSGHLCRTIANPIAADVAALAHQCTDSLASAETATDKNVDVRFSYAVSADNPNGQLASETDPLGRVTSYKYDSNGNLVSETAAGATTSYVYDPSVPAGLAGLHTGVTNPLGATTTYTYDPLGRVVSVNAPGDTQTTAQQTLTGYDEFGAVVSLTQNACTVVGSSCSIWTTLDTLTTVLDSEGRVKSTLDVNTTASTSTNTTYDLRGDAVSQTGTDGTVTTNTYDALGRRISDTPPGLGATIHSYNGLGDETCTVAPASGAATQVPDPNCNAVTAPPNTPANMTTRRNYDLDGRVISQTADVTGAPALTTYGYDALGREYTTTDPAGFTTTTTYDGVGRVTRSVAGSAITDATYDRAGEELSVTLPYASGSTPTFTRLAYDPAGDRCRSVADATVDPNSLANPCTDVIVTDALHNLVTTTYTDAAGNTAATVDPNSVVTRDIYDAQNHLAETITNCTDAGTTPSADPAHCVGGGTRDNVTNVIATYTYGATGAKLSSTTISGTLKTTTNYDGAGRVLASIVDPDNLHLETDYGYDSAGRQISVTSPAGVTSDTIYNSAGQVCRTIANATINPESLTYPCTDTISAKTATANLDTQYTYDAAGNMASMTAPNGLVTGYTYDGQGHLTSMISDQLPNQPVDGADGVNSTINYYYDSAGRHIATATPTDSPGHYEVTWYKYDVMGNLSEEIDNCTSSGTTPDANPAACTGNGTHDGSTNITTSYTYDAAGNKTSMTAPSPANGTSGTATVTTLYAYDSANRLCQVVENATGITPGSVSCFSTPTSNGLTNLSTYYTYFPKGQLSQQYVGVPPTQLQPGQVEPDWIVIIYGQMISASAPDTSYHYDPEGHLIAETDPDLGITTYAYDANGNKASEVDPDGQTIHWYYDGANRLCRRVAFPSGINPAVTGSPCDPTTGPTTGASLETSYGYDKAGNRTSATDVLTGQAISASYDALGRAATVSGSGGPITDPGTTYSPSLSTPARSDPSGSYVFTLDAYGREKGLTDPLTHPDGNGFTWSYGPSGQLDSVIAPTGKSDGSTSDNTTSYTYDPLGRLSGVSTSATISGISTPRASYTYTYNDAGNITSATATLTGGSANGTTNFTYDVLGRITGYTPPSGVQTQSYTWNQLPDRASITTGSTTTTTTFDYADRPYSDSAGGSYNSDKEGRLTSMPGKTMVYDAVGRLVTVKSSSDGTTLASYTYDPLDRLQTLTEASGTTSFLYVGLTNTVALQSTTTGATTTVTKHATDIAGAALYEFDATLGLPSFIGRDGHSDTTWTAGLTGSVSATATYDPFGNLVSSTGSVPAWRWQGSWQDPATGMYYAVARWYSPTLGRFLAVDPLGGGLAAPQTLDPYAYGRGDPIDRVDPDGRCARVVDGDCYRSTSRIQPTPTQTKAQVAKANNTAAADLRTEQMNAANTAAVEAAADAAAKTAAQAQANANSCGADGSRCQTAASKQSQATGSALSDDVDLSKRSKGVTTVSGEGAYAQSVAASDARWWTYLEASKTAYGNANPSYVAGTWVSGSTAYELQNYQATHTLAGQCTDPLSCGAVGFLMAGGDAINGMTAKLQALGNCQSDPVACQRAVNSLSPAGFAADAVTGFAGTLGAAARGDWNSVGYSLGGYTFWAAVTVGTSEVMGSPDLGCSFTSGTLVATVRGSTAISSLRVGDAVLAYDPKTGVTGPHAVTAVMAHNDPVVEHLKLDTGAIDTTPNHPFFTTDRGWAVAGSLVAGEKIRTETGTYTAVISFTLDATPTTMWDLTIDGAHTFFVGPGAVLVHNFCPEGGVPDEPAGGLSKVSDNWLKSHGIDPHDLKGGSNYGSNADIYMDRNGDLWAVSKSGQVGDYLGKVPGR
jgi:RHS repeat-associated protein